jgi:hypothetical protein
MPVDSGHGALLPCRDFQHHRCESVTVRRCCCAQALVRARRPDGALAYRERAHLLILYEDLVACVPSRELRVRTAVQALLLLAGEEIGLVPKSSARSPQKAAGVLDLGL